MSFLESWRGKRELLWPKIIPSCACSSFAREIPAAAKWPRDGRDLKGDGIEPYSAGVDPHGMNKLAIQVMKEAGVDISRQHSKHVDELNHVPFDYVVTVCDDAHEACPRFPGKTKVVHVGFDDPPRLAKTAQTEAEALAITAGCGMKSGNSSRRFRTDWVRRGQTERRP